MFYKVTIDYRYTREVNRDASNLKSEIMMIDVDYDLIKQIHETLDDAGYTITHVDIAEVREVIL